MVRSISEGAIVMIPVWCARCGALNTIPRGSNAKQSQCEACGYVQKIPEPQPNELAGSPSTTGPEPGTYPLAKPPAPRLARPLIPNTGPLEKGRLESRGHWAHFLRAMAGEPSRLQGLGLALIAVSVADLLMTFMLLRTSPRFYESNPIARWFFERWNMAGIVVFKFSLIGFAIAIGEYVERRRPRWGQAVLLIGCVAAIYAFSTGLRLFLGHGGGPHIGAD